MPPDTKGMSNSGESAYSLVITPSQEWLSYRDLCGTEVSWLKCHEILLGYDNGELTVAQKGNCPTGMWKWKFLTGLHLNWRCLAVLSWCKTFFWSFRSGGWSFRSVVRCSEIGIRVEWSFWNDCHLSRPWVPMNFRLGIFGDLTRTRVVFSA